MKLTGTIGKRWTIVIDVAKETVTGVALDLGPLPLDSPVVDGFEEGAKLVLLLELELGGVRDGEGDGALVAGFDVEVRRVRINGVQIQVGAAVRTAVHGSHGFVGVKKLLLITSKDDSLPSLYLLSLKKSKNSQISDLTKQWRRRNSTTVRRAESTVETRPISESPRGTRKHSLNL